ncbi:hypothetical protein ADL34_30785 [Streptomyces sp. NRRL WC-3605]|nr:hypothetical protein ADL33_31500 [Streptomyces sp. NRRL WC-3604]KUL69341.1 hypothetical protein ADL34_30785 [Streptomyces sp. NRRL WC-3605]
MRVRCHQSTKVAHDRPAASRGRVYVRQYSALRTISRRLLTASRRTMSGLGPLAAKIRFVNSPSTPVIPRDARVCSSAGTWTRTAFLCFLARAMNSVTNALRGSASGVSGS